MSSNFQKLNEINTHQFVHTPTPWLMLLLVLGKNLLSKLLHTNSSKIPVTEGISVSEYVLSEEYKFFENSY